MLEDTTDQLNELNFELIPVPIGYRLAHFLIDAVLINIMATGINMVYHYLPADHVIQEIILTNNIPALLHFLKIQLAMSVALNFIYYFPLEMLGKATFGKLLTGARVISANGKQATSLQIFYRTLCRCIPLDGISFLFTNSIGWHDSISKTRVITKLHFDKVIG